MCKAVEELVEKRAAEVAAEVHVTYFVKGLIGLEEVMAATGRSEDEIMAMVKERERE